MKRDMDLIRLLLLQREGDEDAAKAVTAFTEKHGEEGKYIVAHHCALLIDGGYIEGRVVNDHRGIPSGAVLLRLTWSGHEFLDAIRNETVWKHTKDKLLKPGASWTISLLIEVAKAELRKHLGLP